MRNQLLSIFTFIVFALTSNAYASPEHPGERVFQKKSLKIKSGDTKFVSLKQGYYLDRISFEAKRSFFADKDCNLQLTLDGYQYVTLSVSKSGWRTYTTSFAEFSKSIEFKNLSQNGFIKIRNVRILPQRVSVGGHPGPGYDHISNGTDAYYQVAYLKNSVDYLFHVVDPEDRKEYLDGFVVILGNALAILETSTGLSQSARNAVIEVVNYLEKIDPFINELLQTPNLADIGREMKSTKRVLERMLQN